MVLSNWLLTRIVGVVTYLIGVITMVITPAAHPSSEVKAWIKSMAWPHCFAISRSLIWIFLALEDVDKVLPHVSRSVFGHTPKEVSDAVCVRMVPWTSSSGGWHPGRAAPLEEWHRNSITTVALHRLPMPTFGWPELHFSVPASYIAMICDDIDVERS